MRTRKKLKKIILIITATILIVAAVAVAGYMVTIQGIKTTYEARIVSLESIVKSNTKTAYIATTNIRVGDIITDAMVTETTLLCGNEFLFSSDDIGKMALVDIPKDALMVTGYVANTAHTATERDVEYTCLYLSSTLKKGDFVDVRIRFKNGEDYVLLSKKQIKALSLASTSCYLTVDETEMQMMASAIVDCNTYQAILYTTAYILPNAQPSSTINYVPRSESLSLIGDACEEILALDMEQILIKRGELEGRLSRVGSSADVSNFSQSTFETFSNTNGAGVSSGSELDETTDSTEQ